MTTIHYAKQTPTMEAENAKGVWCGPDHVVDYAARRAGLVYDYGAKRIKTHKVEGGGELHTTNVPGIIGITEFFREVPDAAIVLYSAVTTWFKDEGPLFEVKEFFHKNGRESYLTTIKTF